MNSVLTLRELFVVSALSLLFLRAVLALFLLCLCAKYEPDVLSLFLALVKLWSSLGRALSSFVELYRAFPNFVKLYRALSSLSGFVKLCRALSSFVELCRALSSFSRALSSSVKLWSSFVELCGTLSSFGRCRALSSSQAPKQGEGLVSGVDAPEEAFFTLFIINLFNKNPQKFSRAGHRLRRPAPRQGGYGKKKLTPILKIPITTRSIL